MIETVKKFGKTYYRVGREGKLYPTLKKAERQERAAKKADKSRDK